MPVTMNFNGELLLCFVFLKTVHELVLSSSVMSNSLRPCTVARQAPLSVEFSKQEYWSGLPFPPPGHFPDSGIKPTMSFMTSLSHLSLDRYNCKYKKTWKIAYKLGTVQLDSITDMNLGKLGDGEGQGGIVRCRPCGRRESDLTWQQQQWGLCNLFNCFSFGTTKFRQPFFFE